MTTIAKMSLLKALVSSNVDAAAAILANLSEADMKSARNVFNEAYSAAKVLQAEAIKAAETLAAERAKEREDLVAKLMDTVNGLGLDLQLAGETADKALANKYGTEAKKEPRYTFDKATVVVDGKEYVMPRSGNMSQELKDLVAAAGFEPTQRAEFIEKFEKVEESSDEVAE